MIKSTIFLMILAALNVCGDEASACSQREISSSYLDIAIDMISKAKNNIPTCKSIDCPKNQLRNAVDCADILEMGHNESGVYEVWPMNRVTKEKSFNVYCDMDTDGGGWTVIQRRGDFKNPNDLFYKDWEIYKEGFGNIEQDFWLGNDKIFTLTNQKQYSVRFDLKSREQNERYAVYENFWIDDELNKYTLHISVYSGNAGDSMEFHNGQKFTTFDQDNDNYEENCAVEYKGAWWYNACLFGANLNGPYHKENYTRADGIRWDKWTLESLVWNEIKIRPKFFKTSF